MNFGDAMNAEDYPVEHFRQMLALSEDLRARSIQILSHEYHYDTFGSWWTTLRHRGATLRILFDGKEGNLILQRAGEHKPHHRPSQWEDVSCWPVPDRNPERAIREVIEGL